MQFDFGPFHTLAKHRRHSQHRVIETALHIRGALVARQNAARLVDHSYRYLGAANVDPADHVASLVPGFSMIIIWLFKCFIKTNE
jgi:hypothetical protein